MSRAAQQLGRAGGRPGRALAGLAFLAVMAAVVLLIVAAQPEPRPFDPRSGAPDGARGLVLTLRGLGARVDDTTTVPRPGDDVRALVLEDRLDDAQRAELLDFVEAGGTAVVADPASSLHGGSGLDGGAVAVTGGALPAGALPVEREADVLAGDCTIPALSGLVGVHVPDGLLFPVGPSEPSCFTIRTGAPPSPGTSFVIVREVGEGIVVGLGDNEPFTNRSLRRADDAAVMAALLVPDEGASVAFVVGRGASPAIEAVGEGERTLFDLVPTWVRMSVVVAGAAFLLLAVSSSVRVGRVVAEPVATEVVGSELVSATGNLMDRAGHAPSAARLLLRRLRGDLADAHGVDRDAPVEHLDRVVSQRAGTNPGEIAALLGRTVADRVGLGALTADLDRVRRDVLADRGRDGGAGGRTTGDADHPPDLDPRADPARRPDLDSDRRPTPR